MAGVRHHGICKCSNLIFIKIYFIVDIDNCDIMCYNIQELIRRMF